MKPDLILVILGLLIFGFTCLVHPIIIVKLLFIWPKNIYPKLFRDKKILSKYQKLLDLLENDPSRYETQFEGQLNIIRLTGGLCLLGFLLSLCMVFSKSG